ncbi:unnamed protein product [Rhizoctonia solani]|uniref:NADP-dependent oxidoreductase domain-containing protein n=1 Tax=Rhizoctonia solani TaxID=456999 RepID=A0A8H3HZ74_9AGAM|nr:unnamed protein product [Rhizoctonia solani]
MIVHAGHTNCVNSVAFSPDGKSVISGSSDKTVRTWDAHGSSSIGEPLVGHTWEVDSVQYSPLGNLIASASKDTTIRLWDPSTGKQSGAALEGTNCIESVAFSPDAKLITSNCGPSFASTSDDVQLWDLQTRKAASGPFKGHTDNVNSVSFSPDGTRLVSGSNDKTILVWDVERGTTILGPINGHTGGVLSAAFSPNNAQIVSCSSDGTIRLWDSRTGRIVSNSYIGDTYRVNSVCFSPRGTYIASGGSDKAVLLWDVRVGRQVGQPFQEHTYEVTSVTFSPCGQYIASGSRDRRVIIRKVLGEDQYAAANDDDEPQIVTSQMVSCTLITACHTLTVWQSIQQIFDCLCRAGCIDLSSQMDTRQETAMIASGGGFGDIWMGELYSGGKVAIKAWRTTAFGRTEYKTLKWVVEEEEAIQHIKMAYDAGIQTFDTANVYSNGESERILGKAIKQLGLPREEIVVMTKVYYVVRREPGFVLPPGPIADAAGYVNQYGLGRKHIFDSVKHSLERLQLDYIDVLQCHRFDHDTPIAETMQALHDVVKAGYVGYIGMSSCYAYQFQAMQNYAIYHNLTPFISMQNQYNLIYREEEREMIPTLKMFGVGMIPWSPLSQGVLCRPYSETTLRAQTSGIAVFWKQAKEDNKEIIFRLEQIAKTRGISMVQVAIAWVLSKDAITAPIIGATSIKNLENTIDAIDVKLTDEEIRQLEEPYVAQAIQDHA